VAQLAKELGILTVAVVTRPFEMEGNKRARAADNGIAELSKYVDSLITIPNQKLLTVLGGTTTLLDAFKAANQVLQGAVQGIAELITRPGLINVDFADVRTVMSETGMAMMGSGSGTGEGRARVAAEAAVSSPLLEHVDLADAHGILVNVTAGMDMSIGEFQEVGNIVKEFASDDATVVVGTVIDPEMKDELRVTVVATGLNRTAQQGRGRDGFRDSGRDRDYGRDSREGGRDMGRESRDARESGREGMRVVKRPAQSGNHAGSDYAQLDRPAVQRYARAVGDGVGAAQVDEELLDIPAFLRRQAD
jgi:cell division protein FtsZ